MQPDHGWAAASLAIAWLLAQGGHILPIPGTRSVAHLNELAAARDITLTEQMLAEIEQIFPVGWPMGTDIHKPNGLARTLLLIRRLILVFICCGLC